MFFQTVFTSLLVIMLGLALCFTGYRFFTILVSIWGFFAGFQFGATIFTNLFGQGFLSTVISWVVGLLVAITAAALAYLFYAAAVVLLAGFVGYQLGIGIMAGLGFNDGWVTFLVGLLVGLAWVAVAIYLHFPKVLVLILTSLAGAELLLGGIFLAFGRITLTGLRFGAVGAIVRDNWLWGLLYLAIAAVGFYFQWRTTQNFEVEEYSAENPFTTSGTSAATGVATGVATGETAAVAASASAASTPEATEETATSDTPPVSEASETAANGTPPDTTASASAGA
jgi:hypothetical protein